MKYIRAVLTERRGLQFLSYICYIAVVLTIHTVVPTHSTYLHSDRRMRAGKNYQGVLRRPVVVGVRQQSKIAKRKFFKISYNLNPFLIFK